MRLRMISGFVLSLLAAASGGCESATGSNDLSGAWAGETTSVGLEINLEDDSGSLSGSGEMHLGNNRHIISVFGSHGGGVVTLTLRGQQVEYEYLGDIAGSSTINGSVIAPNLSSVTLNLRRR